MYAIKLAKLNQDFWFVFKKDLLNAIFVLQVKKKNKKLKSIKKPKSKNKSKKRISYD